MKDKKSSILIVDDDDDILEILSYNLTKEGFKVYKCNDGIKAIEIAKDKIPDLIILDVMMPGIDGIETCQRMNEISKLKNSIKIFLTARNEDYSQIAGFESGADDYVTKPIKPKVLLSRIKALLRRKKDDPFDSSNQNISLPNLFINMEKFLVVRDNKDIFLPRKEFELLSLLASSPGRVFKRDEILFKVWGDDVVVNDRTIDVHIRKLREKLNLTEIGTVKGIGYKIEF
ncbi:MAG: DNA-binding response regulator [Bacteroidetes bacterium CG2_30_33_31]|nr:MAG: DNA-binding response regulator [Bacteroidetes bacterium CG2_30_33_31]